MKRTYIKPQTSIHHIVSSRLLSGSGPGSGDQHNPGGPSRQMSDFWDDDDMNDEDM